MENVPEIPAALTEQLLRYSNVRSAGVIGWDGDALLVSTRFGQASQVHRVSQPLGMRKQLTFYSEPVGFSRSPDLSQPLGLLIKDQGGDEYRQIYRYNLTDGTTKLLTDGGKSQNGSIAWQRDGKQFAFNGTGRNGRDFDIYVSSLDGPIRRVAEVSGSWAPVDFHPDGNRLLIQNYISVQESSLWLLDLNTGARTQILAPKTGQVAFGEAKFAPDGKGLFYVSDEGTEFQKLRYLDLATNRTEILSASINWDVEGLELSHDGTLLLFEVNEDGRSRLYRMDVASKAITPIAGLPIGVLGGFELHPDGKRLALTLSTAQAPADAYVLDLTSGQLTRWTESEVGGLNTSRFVSPELMRYPTFDKDPATKAQRLIPAWVLKPTKPGKHPVIINIHGGPEGQSRPGFNAYFQYLVTELDIAVILPNVRGSTGYGKTFVSLDNGFKREESVKDIGALLDWIATQPDLDADRVMVWGGSYGGYMTLASMMTYPDKLRAGCDIVGISSWLTFLQNTSPYRQDLRRAEYGDERDPKMRAYLEQISPLTNIDKFRKPMFIVHGYNDPRVPYTEAEQIFKALNDKNIPSWYLMAMDEGHGFRKQSNNEFYQAALTQFIKQYLLKPSM